MDAAESTAPVDLTDIRLAAEACLVLQDVILDRHGAEIEESTRAALGLFARVGLTTSALCHTQAAQAAGTLPDHFEWIKHMMVKSLPHSRAAARDAHRVLTDYSRLGGIDFMAVHATRARERAFSMGQYECGVLFVRTLAAMHVRAYAGTVACVCGETERAGTDVQCDGCDRWMHCACVGIEGDAAGRTPEWFCDMCAIGAPLLSHLLVLDVFTLCNSVLEGSAALQAHSYETMDVSHLSIDAALKTCGHCSTLAKYAYAYAHDALCAAIVMEVDTSLACFGIACAANAVSANEQAISYIMTMTCALGSQCREPVCTHPGIPWIGTYPTDGHDFLAEKEASVRDAMADAHTTHATAVRIHATMLHTFAWNITLAINVQWLRLVDREIAHTIVQAACVYRRMLMESTGTR